MTTIGILWPNVEIQQVDPCPVYTNTLLAELGRTITAEAINEQFVAIEAAMGCMEQLILDNQQTEDTVYTYGTVDGSLTILPSLGNVQKITLVGDVELTVGVPAGDEPNLITLLLADGGSGRFNFPAGAVWTSDSEGTTMDGKPWDATGADGTYGAVVWLVYDGDGWIAMCFSRNDVDTNETASPDDLLNWR